MRSLALSALLLLLAAPIQAQEPRLPDAGVDAAAPAPPAEPVIVPPALAEFVEAKLPPDLDLAAGKYAVTLTLTLDEAGAVTEVLAIASDAPALVDPAVAAARAFRFTPATADGAPVPVQITYTYGFDIQPKLRELAQVFELVRKGYREPLTGVTAFLEETGQTYTSVDEGRLEIVNVAPGEYTLYIPAGTYEELREPFEVTAEDELPPAKRLYLVKRAGALNQTVVRAPKEVRYVARQSLQLEELKRLPGSGGDPLKMIENLPGVARPAFGSGQLVVFGSPPQDSNVLLEGMPFFQLYHFGGLYSIIFPEFIERIDFIPAGFDGSFGDAIGGVVNIKLKEDPVERFHGAFDVNLLHASVFMGAPYSDKGDVQISFRRSYYDQILKAVLSGVDGFDFTTAPAYYDYQVRWQHRFTEKNRIMVFVNGSDDRLEFITDRATEADPSFQGGVSFGTYLHNVIARWTLEPTPHLKNTFQAQFAYQGIEANAFDVIKFEVYQMPILARDELRWRLGDGLTLFTGVEGGVGRFGVKVIAPMPPDPGEAEAPFAAYDVLESEEHGWSVRVSPWASLEWKPFDWWTLVPSFRVDIWENWWRGVAFGPRLSSRVELHDDLALTAAGGLYSQFPVPQVVSRDYGNPDLPPPQAIHSLLGVEWSPMERLTFGAKGFYKYSFDLEEPSDDNSIKYTDEGYGRAYGGDLLIRIDPGGRFFGWIAYTLIWSERYNFDLGRYGYTEFDQRHLLNVLGSYEIGAGWTVGARFRLSSGYPYTPVPGAVFDSDSDGYVSLPNPNLNSARNPLFHSLDLRVDKEWLFDSWRIAAYLEVQNAYNHRNVEGQQYNYDYTEQDYVYGLPILPVLGMRGSF